MAMVQLLEEADITRELEQLERRISERFPHVELVKVCASLVEVANQTSKRVRAAGRPNYLLRLFILLVAVAAGALLVTVGAMLDYAALRLDASAAEWTQAIESVFNILILAGAFLWFLVTLERREKRAFILKHLHELRSFAHVIDMQQLTKDPIAIAEGATRTASSPERNLTPYELARYLDYCAEMLALTGKLAAVYGEQSKDTEVIAAVNDLETLTDGFGRKVWQKIMLLDRQGPR